MSTQDKRNLRRFRKYSGELNRLIADGSLEQIPRRSRNRLLGRLRGLYDGLHGIVSEMTLRRILAASAVVVIGLSACGDPKNTGDAGTDPDGDVAAEVTEDVTPDPLLEPADDPVVEPAEDPTEDAADDPDEDTIDDPVEDPVDDTDLDASDATDAPVDSGSDVTTDSPGVTPSFGAPATNPYGLGTRLDWAVPAFADMDGDADLDLFVGTWDYGNIYYFQNTGSASVPAFASPTTNPWGLTAAYDFAAPEFADMDGDGDTDLWVGEYLDYYGTYGNILYYQRTATDPPFGTPLTTPFGLTKPSYYAFMTFADMDGDGDLDTFIGEYDGDTLFFLNTGSSSAPTFTGPRRNEFGLTSRSYLSAPAAADIDEDGDVDLFIGEWGGTIQYFENTGSRTVPAFAAPVPNPFGITGIGSYRYAFPTFADTDGDGDLDLWVGDDYGNIFFFMNTT